MRRRIVGVTAALLALTVGPLAAQDVTCDDIVFDEQAMTVYPDVNDACLAVYSTDDGARYVVMKARVAQTANVQTVTLAFQHRDGSWGKPHQVTVSDDFRVMVGGEAKQVRDLVMGEQVNLFVREGRWTVAMTDVEVMEMPEEYFTEVVTVPVEVVEVEEPAEAADDEGAVAAAAADAAMDDAAMDDAAMDEAEAEGELVAVEEAPDQDVAAPAGLSWFWIGILLVAIIVMFIVIARRKKKQACRAFDAERHGPDRKTDAVLLHRSHVRTGRGTPAGTGPGDQQACPARSALGRDHRKAPRSHRRRHDVRERRQCGGRRMRDAGRHVHHVGRARLGRRNAGAHFRPEHRESGRHQRGRRRPDRRDP